MKMANGGFNPAVNVQLAGDTESRAIVGVEVSNEGSDSAGLSAPLREQVEKRTRRQGGRTPAGRRVSAVPKTSRQRRPTGGGGVHAAQGGDAIRRAGARNWSPSRATAKRCEPGSSA